MIQGADVHAGYGKINWPVAAAVLGFVYAKCTTGNDPGIDQQFEANVAGCAEHGILPETELISADQINDAYERVLASQVRYRFVIDAKTLA